ncbi:MAG: CDP-alcohol phosphatidyltransferase family protein [Rhizobiaceae bacterium]
MLDGVVRKQIDPVLDAIGKKMAGVGITANGVTITAFLVGVLAMVSISQMWFWTGLILLLLSRLLDGLDGCVARATSPTDFGGYLDIVLDFAFYGMIPLAFIMVDPAQNAIASGVLILSFYVNGASFLAYATMAEKRDLSTVQRGSKSLYFTTGLAEGTETIVTFVLFCLLPQWFAMIAYIFAGICFYTALSRIVLAREVFKD